jgi:hypothetical protein
MKNIEGERVDFDQWNFAENLIKDKDLKACKKASLESESFSKFRQSKDYGVILEGGSNEGGAGNLRRIKKNGALNWLRNNFDQFTKNDMHAVLI